MAVRNPISGGEMRETKQENAKGTRHSVFLLVPGRRIQGSNNMCVCVCVSALVRVYSRDGSDSTGEVMAR